MSDIFSRVESDNDNHIIKDDWDFEALGLNNESSVMRITAFNSKALHQGKILKFSSLLTDVARSWNIWQ